jgi:predicted transglutaminase-like protease
MTKSIKASELDNEIMRAFEECAKANTINVDTTKLDNGEFKYTQVRVWYEMFEAGFKAAQQ